MLHVLYEKLGDHFRTVAQKAQHKYKFHNTNTSFHNTNTNSTTQIQVVTTKIQISQLKYKPSQHKCKFHNTNAKFHNTNTSRHNTNPNTARKDLGLKIAADKFTVGISKEWQACTTYNNGNFCTM